MSEARERRLRRIQLRLGGGADARNTAELGGAAEGLFEYNSASFATFILYSAPRRQAMMPIRCRQAWRLRCRVYAQQHARALSPGGRASFSAEFPSSTCLLRIERAARYSPGRITMRSRLTMTAQSLTMSFRRR